MGMMKASKASHNSSAIRKLGRVTGTGCFLADQGALNQPVKAGSYIENTLRSFILIQHSFVSKSSFNIKQALHFKLNL